MSTPNLLLQKVGSAHDNLNKFVRGCFGWWRYGLSKSETNSSTIHGVIFIVRIGNGLA